MEKLEVNEKEKSKDIFFYIHYKEKKAKMKEVAQYLADRTGLKIVEMAKLRLAKTKKFYTKIL
ncbi:MAG: hypothetical protein ACLRR3_01780 [Eubacterium sp.]